MDRLVVEEHYRDLFINLISKPAKTIFTGFDLRFTKERSRNNNSENLSGGQLCIELACKQHSEVRIQNFR